MGSDQPGNANDGKPENADKPPSKEKWQPPPDRPGSPGQASRIESWGGVMGRVDKPTGENSGDSSENSEIQSPKPQAKEDAGKYKASASEQAGNAGESNVEQGQKSSGERNRQLPRDQPGSPGQASRIESWGGVMGRVDKPAGEDSGDSEKETENRDVQGASAQPEEVTDREDDSGSKQSGSGSAASSEKGEQSPLDEEKTDALPSENSDEGIGALGSESGADDGESSEAEAEALDRRQAHVRSTERVHELGVSAAEGAREEEGDRLRADRPAQRADAAAEQRSDDAGETAAELEPSELLYGERAQTGAVGPRPASWEAEMHRKTDPAERQDELSGADFPRSEEKVDSFVTAEIGAEDIESSKDSGTDVGNDGGDDPAEPYDVDPLERYKRAVSATYQRVFRGDTRSPEEIFIRGDGFRARGTSNDLKRYAERNEPSRFIGTSMTEDAAKPFTVSVQGNKRKLHGWVYEIHSSAPAINVNKALGLTYRLLLWGQAEKEMAFLDHIPRESIKCAREVRGLAYTGRVVENPYFRER